MWILAPVVLLRYFVSGGSPLTDFGTVFHEQVLPYAFGFEAAEAVAAGCPACVGVALAGARRAVACG